MRLRDKESLLHKDDKTAVCEIHKAGELAALNRMADSLVPGALPHFYTMGTTSKWKLTWVKDYNAYQIESISEGEKDTGLANIPATHDTGTAGVVQDLVASLSLTSCQNLYYDEQLNMGARSFDIRANATKDDASVGRRKDSTWRRIMAVSGKKTEVILHYSQSLIHHLLF